MAWLHHWEDEIIQRIKELKQSNRQMAQQFQALENLSRTSTSLQFGWGAKSAPWQKAELTSCSQCASGSYALHESLCRA